MPRYTNTQDTDFNGAIRSGYIINDTANGELKPMRAEEVIARLELYESNLLSLQAKINRLSDLIQAL